MRELLKSKSMIGLIIFILGAVYLNSVSIKNEMKTKNVSDSKVEIVYNK